MKPALDTQSWARLLLSVSEEIAHRWLDVWGAPLREAALVTIELPWTRQIAVHAGLAYQRLSQDWIVHPPPGDKLEFWVDKSAGSAGPRYVDLPASLTNHPPGLLEHELKGAPKRGFPLTNDNFVVRVERGLLSVTLVDLREGRGADPPTPGDYTLAVEGERVVVFVALGRS